MADARGAKKAESKTIKKAETKPAPQKTMKTRYFIGKGVEITEAQAKEHVKKQNEKGM
ncbi:hypothetical protein [Christensenella minuta]|uniref:Uncharacterized protein n=1 Tax=Christensenella minuta TaxID=626937 RepID=A0A136Q8N7_9FIRM|nr:hypothetical protein [Christensenella minuta]KXK67032.1 hypothetical protein HMPREF3293_00099 [Christensenella minuta]